MQESMKSLPIASWKLAAKTTESSHTKKAIPDRYLLSKCAKTITGDLNDDNCMSQRKTRR
jgi:hypothetical protein